MKLRERIDAIQELEQLVTNSNNDIDNLEVKDCILYSLLHDETHLDASNLGTTNNVIVLITRIAACFPLIDTVDLSNNKAYGGIDIVKNLAKLPNLKTLIISGNFFTECNQVEKIALILKQSKSFCTLDIRENNYSFDDKNIIKKIFYIHHEVMELKIQDSARGDLTLSNFKFKEQINLEENYQSDLLINEDLKCYGDYHIDYIM